LRGLGNDIVDLADIETRGKGNDCRFLSRVLTGGEREMLRPGGQDRLLWLFWAAKETAFKAASRVMEDLSFIPRRFEVSLATSEAVFPKGRPALLRGLVETPGPPVYVEACLCPDYVHVIGATDADALKEVIFGHHLLADKADGSPGQTSSREARWAAASALAGRLGLEPSEIEIKRRPLTAGRLGPPFPCRQDIPLPYDLSLSHHGRFVAYAFVTK